MEIKDKLALNGMSWEAAYEIEYNTIGSFQTSNSNTPGFFFNGNVIHIIYRKYIDIMHLILQF